jgi:amino acid adenylation domain-containing protein
MSSPLRLLQTTLQRSAERVPQKTALVVGPDRITYSQLWERSVRLSNALRNQGVRRGDRVAIFLDNTWQCVVALYGTLLADAAFVIVNPQTKYDKLTYILNDSGATAMVTDAHLQGSFVPAVGSASSLLSVLVTGGVPAGPSPLPMLDFDAALNSASADAIGQNNISIDLSSLIYTSGSTGEPKGVMHTHQSMLFALQSLVEYMRLQEDDRLLCVLPLAFDYGMYQLLMTVHLGATLVLERSFTYPAQVFKVMNDEGVTIFPGVPTVFAMLLATHEKQALQFPLVRRVTNTAAALPTSFNLRLREVFPNAEIFRMYGLTECKRVSYLPPEEIDTKPNSVGIAIPGTEVMVLDDSGVRVKPGETGKLYVRGAHVMLGYWNQPEKTARMLKAGPYPGERVLCTHDLFTIDEDGYLYFVGRSDDIIKTRGEKVSPVEVENAMFAIPGIREVAVIGIPDEVLGQAVRAYVVLQSDSGLSEKQIRAMCLARMENFMVPKEIILTPELPKTTTGKISKKTLGEG